MDGSCDPSVAADFLRSLAHPMRLRILCRLLEGELSVAGFETELGLKQPSLSQQLGQLREAGLVTSRREAKSIFYRLSDDRIETILNALWEIFADARPVLGHVRPPAPPPPPTPPRPAIAPTECGVFPVVGWPDSSRNQPHG